MTAFIQRCLVTAAALALTSCEQPPAPQFSLSIQPDADDATRVGVVASASASWRWEKLRSDGDGFDGCLTLRTADAALDATIAGRHQIDGGVLRFVPSVPLLQGVEYEARLDLSHLTSSVPGQSAPLTARYRVPETSRQSAPAVTAIYPTVAELPANHLKFYLVFSEPMRPGDILKHFRLAEAGAGDVPEPFRETELWSPDGRRLTLWFHPGRQKTGVNLNVEMGPILKAGRRYTLIISSNWTAASGIPLGRDVEKSFRAVAPDRRQPRVQDWKIHRPVAGSLDPLRVDFGEPIDWAMLHGSLRVEMAGGPAVVGTATVAAGEAAWEFRPTVAWVPGDYRVSVPGALEDLAGNSLVRPFERDAAQAEPTLPPERVFVGFTIPGRKNN